MPANFFLHRLVGTVKPVYFISAHKINYPFTIIIIIVTHRNTDKLVHGITIESYLQRHASYYKRRGWMHKITASDEPESRTTRR
jgi:hypothetical protein